MSKSWCSVKVSYDGNGAEQKYKRDIGSDIHPLADQFVVDAKTEFMNQINANLGPGVAPATLNQFGTTGLRVYKKKDPGVYYEEI